MSDYMDRTLGLGFGTKGSSLILLGLLVALAVYATIQSGSQVGVPAGCRLFGQLSARRENKRRARRADSRPKSRQPAPVKRYTNLKTALGAPPPGHYQHRTGCAYLERFRSRCTTAVARALSSAPRGPACLLATARELESSRY